LLIQKQNNVSFKSFKVDATGKPYLKNALPGVVGSNQNFASKEPLDILAAFKKKMDALAKTLNKDAKTKGLDIVLTEDIDKEFDKYEKYPALTLQKKGQKVGDSLYLSELKNPTEKDGDYDETGVFRPKNIALKILTVDFSKHEFDSIVKKASDWLKKTTPKISEPKLQKTKAAPKTLDDAIKNIFGQ